MRNGLENDYLIGTIITLDNTNEIPQELKIFDWNFIRAVGRYKYYERVR